MNTISKKLHEQQLMNILEKVKIIDNHNYEIAGKKIPVYQQQPKFEYIGDLALFGKNEEQDPIHQKKALIQHLTNALYSNFYCEIPDEAVHLKLPSVKERNEFMNQLSKANYSTQQPDPNWRVYSVQPNGSGFAEKNGQLRPVQPNTYVPNPYQSQLTVNQTIHFYRQKENRIVQPVFYHVHGNEYLAPDSNMIRIYWNIQPKGAALLIEQITKLLNDYRIPFNFKCLNHPDLFNRSDSAVLYFDKTDLSIINSILPIIIQAVQPYLKREVPLFTDILHPGVSRAEDPGDGQSFGMSRCKIIAEALVTLSKLKLSKKKKFESLCQALLKKGINPQQMSINPHTKHFLLRA